MKHGGGYYVKDVDFSESIPDKKDHDSENIKVIKERINASRPYNLFIFFVGKNIKNYGDGTFGWGSEGNFYLDFVQPENKFEEKIRSFYYNNGNNYCNYTFIVHTMWIATLILITCNLIKTKFSSNFLEIKGFLCLSLIGLSIYLILFECRARYLFVLVPYFVMLAVFGLNNLVYVKKFIITKGN